VGACNNIGAINPAVLRPGRFDHHVPVPLPDAAMLAGVLVRHLGPASPATEIGDLARRAVGRSAADLDAAIRAARSLARHEARDVTLEDVARALGLGTDTSAVDWRVAVHECGHAIVAAALRNSMVTRITLLPDGGETTRQQRHNASMMSDIEVELATQLAGRAPEAVVFAEVSAGGGGGAESDLAHATRLALAVHTQLGLGWNGPVWSDGSPDLALRDPGLRLLVRRRLEDAERRAKAILADQQDLLLAMARDLLRQRRLAGQELEHWLAQVRAVDAAVQCETDENQQNCADMAKHKAKPSG
jgi:ATP-dependent Zn protease